MLGRLYYDALHSAGIAALARRLRQGALVLCYHNVVPQSSRGSFGDPGLHLPLDQFTAQAKWLNDHYRVIPLSELASRLTSGRSVRGLASITFDDAYTGALTLAWPLLRTLGLPATVFVVAAAPEQRPLFWWDHPAVVRTTGAGSRERRLLTLGGDAGRVLADVGASTASDVPITHLPAAWPLIAQQTAAGLELGAHTLSHRTLTTLDDRELARELCDAMTLIEQRTAVRPAAFSYPYGVWDARVRDAVRRAGYRIAVTLDYGLNPSGIDPCELRRVNVPASISLSAFAGWTAGLRPNRDRAADPSRSPRAPVARDRRQSAVSASEA